MDVMFLQLSSISMILLSLYIIIIIPLYFFVSILGKDKCNNKCSLPGIHKNLFRHLNNYHIELSPIQIILMALLYYLFV